MRTPSNKQNRRRSRRQELELAEAGGGRVQKGSGSLPWAKGDVRRRGKFRAECKFTRKASFSVKRTLLDKIRSECSFDETPVLDIAFLDKDGRNTDRWVAIPYSVWVELQNQD